jgi:hypothetical protein
MLKQKSLDEAKLLAACVFSMITDHKKEWSVLMEWQCICRRLVAQIIQTIVSIAFEVLP